LPAVLANDRFEFLALFLVASVINAISVKKKRVSRTDQCEFCDIGEVRSPLTEMHGEIKASIRMVFRNLQSEGQGLHYPVLMDVHKICEILPRTATVEDARK
jgi:hypothetical protein